MVIYPVTAYLVSPKRPYARWKGAIFASFFLLAVFLVQLYYENVSKGPNHYQLLNVTRYDGGSIIKKAYKRLSLELHPDKNKAASAVEEFRKVKQAYDVLSNHEFKNAYDRFGDQGVKVVAHSVMDTRHILLQLIVYYCSSAIFAFLMTMSEPSGDAMQVSLVGLATMLVIESLLVIEEVPLPRWFFPYNTPHDVVAFLHSLYPTFMNGSRSIMGAFYVDTKAVREEALQSLIEASKATTLRASSLIQSILSNQNYLTQVGEDEAEGGIMANAIRAIRKCVALSPDRVEVGKTVLDRAEVVKDPVALRSRDDRLGPNRYFWILYMLAYGAARYLFIKSPKQK